MRAGRLLEILFGDCILVVCDVNGKNETQWEAEEFTSKFSYNEVIKITPLNKQEILVFVYPDTAKALFEKRYNDVIVCADTIEQHTFNDDILYINGWKG